MPHATEVISVASATGQQRLFTLTTLISAKRTLAIVSLRKLQLPLERLEARLLAQWIHERIGFQFHQPRITQSHRGVEPLESFRATYIKRRTTNVITALTS